MRHRKATNSLGRTQAHRKAMLSNMATSLILHKRITTTVAKGRALRKYVEPLITKSKNDTMHSRRAVFAHLKSKEAVNELFREVSVKVASRPGGYTRILKTGSRYGDNADMCIVELVDYNEAMLEAKMEKEEAQKKTRRGTRRRGGKKTTAEQAVNQSAKDQKSADQPEKIDKEPEKEAKGEKAKPKETASEKPKENVVTETEKNTENTKEKVEESKTEAEKPPAKPEKEKKKEDEEKTSREDEKEIDGEDKKA